MQAGYPSGFRPNNRGHDQPVPDAIVIGAGQNGLVAANVLADAGLSVTVFEADESIGGAVRSGELVEPGFVNDLYSAFYPLAVSSPAMRAMERPLEARTSCARTPDARRTLRRALAGHRRDGRVARRVRRRRR
jgi:phytoene dehydrogenase-like protein